MVCAISGLVALIEHEFKDSRFVFKDGLYWRRDGTFINLGSIRLKEKKQYCGNHPEACNLLFPKKEPTAPFLEGADWVEFNDRLNDVLDASRVSAYVYSVQVVIRRGLERCTAYVVSQKSIDRQMRWVGNTEWGRLGVFADWTGSPAPRASFPEGTPGINEQQNYHVVG
jgi:hypothetical protein